MLGIAGACSRLVGEILQALRVARSSSSPCSLDHHKSPTCQPQNAGHQVDDDLMMRALTTVFGMENNGRIKKERVRRVVEKLGLMYGEEEEEEEEEEGEADRSGSDMTDQRGVEDEVPVEEVISGLEDAPDRRQLLLDAFKIFDEDGNGFIDAVELKRVLQCLGLDKGWDMSEIEKMLKVVDLNLDGKVDFTEFEVMMS